MVLCVLCVGTAPCIYAQGSHQVSRQVVRKLTQEQVLAKKAQVKLLQRAKASREEREIKRNMRLQAAAQAARSYHPLTEHAPIVPTPSDKLKINAYRLTPEQTQGTITRYQNLMKDFLSFKSNWEARVFYLELYKNLNAISPMEKKQLVRESAELLSRVKYQKEFLLKDDRPLQQAYDYLVEALETLEPAYFGIFKKTTAATRTDRPFMPDQFFLRDPSLSQWRDVQWEDYQPMSSGAKELVMPIANALPKNLNIALVNDHPAMVASFKNWASAGYFGEGATVEVFQTADALLKTRKEYDFIITDLLVPGGGGQYLAYYLRKNGYNKPIIAMSEYREEDCRATELFAGGIDGYIYADDFFRNYVGYRLFPAALKTYLDMKAQYGWQH